MSFVQSVPFVSRFVLFVPFASRFVSSVSFVPFVLFVLFVPFVFVARQIVRGIFRMSSTCRAAVVQQSSI